MYKKRGRKIVFFSIYISIIAIILFSGITVASFDKGDLSHFLKSEYSPDEKIQGWINISLDSESANSLLETNFGDSMELLEFLELNNLQKQTDFDCYPTLDCSSSYDTNNPENSKIINLGDNDEKLIAFVIKNALNVNIVNFSLEFNSDVQSSCENQIELDLLDNRETNFQNNKVKTETCYDRDYGCYSDSDFSNEYGTIGINPYCEKIKLKASPGFRLGAEIKKKTGGTKKGGIFLAIYEENLKRVECELKNLPENEDEIFCDVEYNVFDEKNYFVCLYANQSTDYQIRTESEEGCGFNGNPRENPYYTTDYKISAQSLKYNYISQNEINANTFTTNGLNANLINYIQNYVDQKYEGNCKDQDCVIPIKIKSNEIQKLAINSGKIIYNKIGASEVETNQMYDAEKDSAIIDMPFTKLDLEKTNFSVPNVYGNITLEIELDRDEILTERILIKKLPFILSVTPRNVPAALESRFFLLTDATDNSTISEYKWEFGDNITKTTTTPSVLHTYKKIGSYDLKITIKDSKGATNSETFKISVASPEDSINNTLVEKKLRAELIETKINALPHWQKSAIQKNFDINQITDDLNNIETNFRLASTSEEYTEIMANLSKIKIPLDIQQTELFSFDFYNDPQKIDLNKIAEVSMSEQISSEDSQKYKEAISNWFIETFNSKISYRVISVFNEDSIEELATVYKISIIPKKELENEVYWIIDQNEDNIFFKENYGEDSTENYTYIEISEYDFENVNEKTIEFAVTEALGVYELETYISPSLDNLEIKKPVGVCNSNRICEGYLGETSKNCPIDCFRWFRFLIATIGLVIVGLIVYVIIQEWYKKNYEKKLFKNKNEVYNLANFIQNAKNQGLTENQIISQLKQKGWSSEQIKYVIKKVEGKKIMPFEIPIFKWLEKIKLKRGVEKYKKDKQRTEDPLKKYINSKFN